MQHPFRIKICGVTNSADAAMIAATDVDAIGLNFYEKSKRFVSHLDASFISQELRGQVKLVGVFVNESAEEIRVTAGHVGLDYVQLHGDESIEFIRSLGDLKVIRALRLKANKSDELKTQVAELIESTNNLHAILLDAFDPDEYGGTGKQVDWDQVAQLDCFSEVPLILAGGLVRENVGEAIEKVRPVGVDVASGVESSPGKKDRHLVDDFAISATKAFEAIV